MDFTGIGRDPQGLRKTMKQLNQDSRDSWPPFRPRISSAVINIEVAMTQNSETENTHRIFRLNSLFNVTIIQNT
jgi:hypothetical protein